MIDSEIPDDFQEQNELFRKLGFYMGDYTFEVDMMDECVKNVNARNVIIDIFNELTYGGDIQKNNFKKKN